MLIIIRLYLLLQPRMAGQHVNHVLKHARLFLAESICQILPDSVQFETLRLTMS